MRGLLAVLAICRIWEGGAVMCKVMRAQGKGLALRGILERGSCATPHRSQLNCCDGTSRPQRPGVGNVWTNVLQSKSLWQTLPGMAASGALLGPNLDNYHSAFGVLSYEHPLHLDMAGMRLLTTDWWVPILFAVAGAGIGGLYVLFDEVFATPSLARRPTPPMVFLCISLFVSQYYLSGLLTYIGADPQLLYAVLGVMCALIFVKFDNTVSGLLVSILTAVLGPVIEVAIINILQLYHYTSPDIWGIPYWILLVYFAGGPAVGGLARLLHDSKRS